MVIKVPGAKQSKGTLLTEATLYSKVIQQELDEIAAKRKLLMLNLFSPDWDRLAARPTGTIESLVAQSVGLVPALAAPGFIDEAKRFFYARNDSVSISKLNAFLRRLADARENIAPLGELHPIEGEEARFKKSDFLVFAGRLGWELPKEFKQFDGNAIQTDNQSKSINQKRDEDFNKWIVDKKPDLNGMTKEEIKNALHAWSQIKPALWVSGFDGWWKKQSFHKGNPGRRPG